MWSIFKLLVYVSVFRSDWNQFSPHLQNVAKLLKNAIVGKERWSVYCESAGKKGAERLIVALLFMGTQHSSFQRWSCWSNMWVLSQRGNTDQVVQWAKAGVVKSSSEKNPTSLGGTKYPCAGYGLKLSSLLRCEPLCEALDANVKADSDSWSWLLSKFHRKRKNGEIWSVITLKVSLALFVLSAQCRTMSWYCTSRSTTACWSAFLRPSSSACLLKGLRRKPRGSYRLSSVTRK